MELDQYLFKKALTFFRRLRETPVPPEVVARTARLDALLPRLTTVARALTGEAMTVQAAEREGGWRGGAFLLPAAMAQCPTAELNEQYYIFRVCFMAAQRSLGHNWAEGETRTPEESRSKAREHSAGVLERMAEEYPAAAAWFPELAGYFAGAPEWLFGRWYAPLPAGEAQTSATDERPTGKEASPTTVKKARPKDEVKTLEVNRREIADYTLNHSFEKVETAEEFQGTWRDLDGADDLGEHADALEEVNLNQMVRANDPTRSMLEADYAGGGTLLEAADAETPAGETVHYYDEWDCSRREYRTGYCAVFAGTQRETSPGYYADTMRQHRQTLARLHKRFGFFHNKLVEMRRQKDGADLDMDVMVENFAELRAGRTPSENVYVSSRARERDVAILMLADGSLSTDSYTDNRRVCDVIKQSALLFGELLAEYGIRFQIDAFCSQTRNYCSYTTLKSFGGEWAAGRARIGALAPRGYTRIGPALRHAAAMLDREQARLKWLLLISDGKPNDYDRYEGRYGIQDVRQAIREISGKGMHIHALAVEASAKQYFPLMLGESGYRILPHARMLPDALAECYGAILNSRRI